MTSKLIVDPPGGWKYGFPAPRDETISYREQLRRHRYPEADIELAEKWSRYWTHEEASDPS